MKLTLDTTQANASQMKRLKTLMALLKKAQAFQNTTVRVVHHYTRQEWERDFTFESLDGSKQCYLRGRGGMIQQGDYMVVQSGSDIIRYQIDEIDYDTHASNGWLALLHPCYQQVADYRFRMQSADLSFTTSV
ncbi:hypothetical protein H6F76_03725 [Leptolyngbya sp. FACHB-321]|uniref:hypothetical protein n=1 Tax=Leptolyngbya sp. FACHB-321 TaxID=2692807 RepID=UPI0016888526|nr:hypothetical protein [Leptolyngbya sp. FACHB-321]MBD2034155.1 hypothetical protein [Leptolyngbya sp. FACHB-321]